MPGEVQAGVVVASWKRGTKGADWLVVARPPSAPINWVTLVAMERGMRTGSKAGIEIKERAMRRVAGVAVAWLDAIPGGNQPPVRVRMALLGGVTGTLSIYGFSTAAQADENRAAVEQILTLAATRLGQRIPPPSYLLGFVTGFSLVVFTALGLATSLVVTHLRRERQARAARQATVLGRQP
jgi:hypothetical protein